MADFTRPRTPEERPSQRFTGPVYATDVFVRGIISGAVRASAKILTALGQAGAPGDISLAGATAAAGPPAGASNSFPAGNTLVADNQGNLYETLDGGATWKAVANSTLFGHASAIVNAGGAPSSTAGRFLIQCGTTVVTTSAGGGFNINYPTAFPNGVLFCVATMGDNGNGKANIMGIQANHTLGQYNMVAMDSTTGGTLNNVTIRVNWIAIGF